jgi:transposase
MGLGRPYLSLLPQTAAQRHHDLRDIFNAVRYIVRTGAPWRWRPTNFPPWKGGVPADAPLDRCGVF